MRQIQRGLPYGFKLFPYGWRLKPFVLMPELGLSDRVPRSPVYGLVLPWWL